MIVTIDWAEPLEDREKRALAFRLAAELEDATTSFAATHGVPDPGWLITIVRRHVDGSPAIYIELAKESDAGTAELVVDFVRDNLDVSFDAIDSIAAVHR